MPVTALNTVDELKAAIENGAPVIVDCLAEWCHTCHKMLPEVERLSSKYSSVSFFKVDCDDLESVTEEYNVVKMPTFLFFVGGEEVGRHEGLDPGGRIQALLDLHVQADGAKSKTSAPTHAPAPAPAPAPAQAPAPSAPAVTEPQPAAEPPAPLPPAPLGSVRLFVAGSASGAGKSTVSLALLGAALESGLYCPGELAYIKPATQGVQQTLTAKFCASKGIACCHVGPVVFYRGFTQAYLEGKTDTTEQMLDKVRQAVDDISLGKRLIIIDGVGYPAVGSIVGVSNAAVARVVGAAVLLVGKAGLGDAVDSFNLSCSYFEAAGCPVLGTVLNRVGAGKQFEKTKAVYSYFAQQRPHQRVYGLLLENEVFKAEHDSYAPPGETNACSITKGAPKLSMLVASPCSPQELKLCSSMVKGFLDALSALSYHTLLTDGAEACDLSRKQWQPSSGAQKPTAAQKPGGAESNGGAATTAAQKHSSVALPGRLTESPYRGSILSRLTERVAIWFAAPPSNGGVALVAGAILVGSLARTR